MSSDPPHATQTVVVAAGTVDCMSSSEHSAAALGGSLTPGVLYATPDLVFLRPKALTVALAVAGLLSFLGTLPLLAALKQPGTTTTNQVDEFFVHGTVVKPDRLILVEGFQQAAQGWYLDPGASGTLVYRVAGHPGTTTAVNLWLNLTGGVSDAVSVSAPGLPAVRIATNLRSFGDRLEIPSEYANASSVDVQIDGSNASAVQQLVIDKISTYSVTGTDPRPPPIYSFVAFGVLAGLISFALLRRRQHAIPTSAGIGLVAALAASTRIAALFTLHLPTEPDAIGYRTYAERFQWWPLFDNGIFSGNFYEREPLFPMVVHVYFQLIGSSDFHVRVVSATLSVAVVILSVVAARRRLQTWWGPLLVGLVMAISGPLIQESYRGLRLEQETLLILGLYLALDREPARRPVLDAIAIGLLGAAMALARTYFIPVFIAAVAVSFLLRYRSLPKVVGLVAIATLMMGGAEVAHRIGLYEHHGTAFFDTNGYVRWDANEELYRFHRPLPHIELFPTVTQYQTLGNYSGPLISSYQYLFVIHSPVEFARDSLAGTRLMFDSLDSFIFDVRAAVDVHKFPARLAPLAKSVATRFDILLSWTVVLGLLAMCLRAWREPRLIILPTIVVTWIGMTAFLLDHQLLEKYRHTWQTYPLVLIAGAWLLERIALYVAPRIKARQVLNAEVALFAGGLILTLGSTVAPPSVRYGLVVLAASGVGLLTYRRPAWGVGAALLSISAGTGLAGAAVALASALAILYRVRPAARSLLPLVALIPLALAMVFGGATVSVAGLEAAAVMIAVVAAVMLAVREPAIREQLVWLLAGIAPLAGLVYFLAPSAPGVVELAPAGVVAAAWLYLNGHRTALVLGLLDLALVLLIEPLAAWVAVAVVVAWLAIQAGRIPRSRRLAVAGGLAGLLALLAVGASLAATTPAATAGWTTRLDSPSASVRQDITVDSTSENSIWVYGRRSTALTDFPFTVLVDGSPVTTDLNSSLPTDVMTWNRIPVSPTLHVGQRLEVRIVAGGQPNPVDRYIELGGVYATVDGISSPGANGTYLVVLGDDSIPMAPAGLPEPMVRNRLQLPMGEWLPGERTAPPESRKEASVLQIWRETLAVAISRPVGAGTGNLGTALNREGAGLGPGLTARDELLQALGEWGWLGLASLVLVLAVAGWAARRARDQLPIALLSLAAITMLAESVLAEPASAVGVWLAVGFCLGAIESRAAGRSTSQASTDGTRPATSPREAIHAG